MSNQIGPRPVVMDIGSHWARLGFAGDDLPRRIEPSVIGRVTDMSDTLVTDSFNSTTLKTVIPLTPYEKIDRLSVAQIWDIDALDEKTVETTLDEESLEQLLGALTSESVLSDYPVLFIEPIRHDKSVRAAAAEILFEKFQVHSVFIGKASTFATYGCGRISGLVLDAGHSRITAAAVVDGYTCQSSVEESSIGGAVLTKRISDACPNLPPAYALKQRASDTPLTRKWMQSVLPDVLSTEMTEYTEPTYYSWSQQTFAEMIKELYCMCRKAKNEQPKKRKTNNLVLPDGKELPIEDLQSLPEDYLFGNTEANVVSLIAASLKSVEVTTKHPFQHVIVTGGTSLFPGFVERLTNDLNDNEELPTMEVIASDRLGERRHCAWIGGSIMACLGSFESFSVPRASYNEKGCDVMELQCP
eukprot:GHVO01039141.1.p1 GENE.GHVO01039141.1~~GHVO01039141.1.p1  ORF type:complete len:423 (-),score=74.69 GHVO01039141.1:274-1518(-)